MDFTTKPPPHLSIPYHEMCEWIDEKVRVWVWVWVWVVDGLGWYHINNQPLPIIYTSQIKARNGRPVEMDEIKKHYLDVYKEAPVSAAPKSASGKKRKASDAIEIDADEADADADAGEAGAPMKKVKSRKALAQMIRDLVEQHQQIVYKLMSVAAELDL